MVIYAFSYPLRENDIFTCNMLQAITFHTAWPCACEHTNALFRPKIYPQKCAGNLLASSQAGLYTQELNLNYWAEAEEPIWYFPG